MTRWHGTPGTPAQIADRILEQVRSGGVRTAGEYVALVSVVDSLPMKVRTWVWQQIEGEIGYAAVVYLRTWNNNTMAARS